MLFTPFLAAAILLHQFYWPELIALIAVACLFAIKEPLVVVARQRFIWNQEHAETKAARGRFWSNWCCSPCAGWRPFVALFFGAATFTALAVTANVRNRQRSKWFQVASAIALSATSLIACLAARGAIPEWCWLLWMLCALQAAAGIFVVHERLDARIAARKGEPPASENRRAAFLCQTVLIAAAIAFGIAGRPWISAALVFAMIGYLIDLHRQTQVPSLQMPLKRVGLQALGLSIAYAFLVIAGLWP